MLVQFVRDFSYTLLTQKEAGGQPLNFVGLIDVNWVTDYNFMVFAAENTL